MTPGLMNIKPMTMSRIINAIHTMANCVCIVSHPLAKLHKAFETKHSNHKATQHSEFETIHRQSFIRQSISILSGTYFTHNSSAQPLKPTSSLPSTHSSCSHSSLPNMSTPQHNIASRQPRIPLKKNGHNALCTSNAIPNCKEPPQPSAYEYQKASGYKNSFQYSQYPQPSADEFNRALANQRQPPTPARTPSPQLSIISTDGQNPIRETRNHKEDRYYAHFQPASGKPEGLGWAIGQEAVPSYNTTFENVKRVPDFQEKNEKYDEDGGRCGCLMV
ncbi:hypothetical protein EAF04_002866 [Stromatinia cepivora]|nr:hypothetical protein EAF04_002866 [Stromatinia cepivora]